jgi:8-oxo-dGTP pyrophosphatase MutT (NUDIX family)
MGFELPPPRLRKWTRTATEELADYGVFRVVRYTMHDAAGAPRRPVHCYQCPNWVNVVARTPTGEIVMIWQYRFGTDSVTLEVPGGMIDPDEEPLEAARRELREETGYEAESFELLSVVEPNPALQGNRCFTYLAKGARLAGGTSFDELEECETVLVPETALGEIIDAGKVTHALVISALETYGRKMR